MAEQTFPTIDAGMQFDWGKTSLDYERYRPGPPESFYLKLAALDIGLAGQVMLDLGTGTGLLARRFARSGAEVCGIDQSAEQIEVADRSAQRESLDIEFRTATAEDIPYQNDRFDVVSANQCWLYFDPVRAIPEVCRVLKPGGRLVVSYFNFLPRLDPVVTASERLVLKFNPDWSGADWDGNVEPLPEWAATRFRLTGFFAYDEAIPFNRESWRGRMRALRGIAAALPQERVESFDRELSELLDSITGPQFEVLHRIHAHILAPRARTAAIR